MKRLMFLPALLLLGGCAALSQNFDTSTLNDEISDLTGPSPTLSATPARSALSCVKEHRNENQDLRIAISDITDGTGARTTTDNSTLLTQRPDLMFTVGLVKTGVRVINRTSTRVAEWEMGQAMERRLGEGTPVYLEGMEFDYRPIEAGTLLGSTHYVTGALTEVNWNINSTTVEGGVLGFSSGARTFHISVAADLMVTDTKTTEVVIAESYQKQIVGREVNRGLFRFFEVDNSDVLGPVELFDISIGEQQNEPVQTAVRWLIETAAYDVASELTGTKDECDAVAFQYKFQDPPLQDGYSTATPRSDLSSIRPVSRQES